MSLVPLPSILDPVGHGRWRWYCHHCKKFGLVKAVKQETAIRRLDKHVTMKHSRYERWELSDGNEEATRP